MWFPVVARALLGASMASALALPDVPTAPKDPGHTMKLFTLEQMKEAFSNGTLPPILAPISHKEPKAQTNAIFKVNAVNANAGCSANPNLRFEWRDYSDSDRHALVDSIQCLRTRPARIAGSNNRFEDFAVIHRNFSPNIHNNQKFLLWHRYFLWAFEQILREECGFNRAFVWWDETKDAGRFSQLDMFSPNFFGTMHGCLNDGVSYLLLPHPPRPRCHSAIYGMLTSTSCRDLPAFSRLAAVACPATAPPRTRSSATRNSRTTAAA